MGLEFSSSTCHLFEMVSGNIKRGAHMYATEKIYVIAYLATRFSTIHGRIELRTIRTSNNYAYHRRCQFWVGMAFGVHHTSRVDTGSSKLPRNLTDRFIAERNSWDAATSNSPALTSRNDDSAEGRGLEMIGWCASACLCFNRGDISSGKCSRGPSPIADKSEWDE